MTALQPLIATRLVRLTSDGQVLVEDPRLALERLIDGEESRSSPPRTLAEARGAISQFSAEHRLGRGDLADEVRRRWEVVAAEAASSLVQHLTRSTSGTIRSSILTVAAGPGVDPDARRATQAALTDGREQRALYSFAVLDDPGEREWMQSWAAIGEQQRIVEVPPSEFAVFGADAVLAAASGGRRRRLRRHPRRDARRGVHGVFDLAWAGALPAPTPGHQRVRPPAAGPAALAGYKDEAIARYLGWGVRTVRRRVSGLMDALGADTRFQLGVAAQQRGLLDVQGRGAEGTRFGRAGPSR